VAVFDRKATEYAALSSKFSLRLAFQLWVCRMFASRQPVPPKFFFVIGNRPPWDMIGVDIETGKESDETTEIQNASDWRRAWNQLGLASIRRELDAWVA
jgi:hypothetical protein